MQQRSSRQFRLELAVLVGTGLVIAMFNMVTLGFPFFGSGATLLIGFLIVGLFAAMDLALAGERQAMQDAIDHNPSFNPPENFYPITKKFFLLATSITALVSIVMIFVISMDIFWIIQAKETDEALSDLQLMVTIEIVFVMTVFLALIINLIWSYSRNLKIIFNNQTSVLTGVSGGELDRFVPVLTKDEFGFIAGHTNNMIIGLQDRMRLMEGVQIASEVQKNLLPKQAPDLPGLDIHGLCLFSDETGGDFYDYFPMVGRDNQECLGIVIGDVTGHGVGAALLMAATRSMLRQRAGSAGDPATNLEDVNRQLCRDTVGSGRFVTLFHLALDHANGVMHYAGAGHDPALIFGPEPGGVRELEPGGIPLGVEPDWEYNEYSTPALIKGEVLLLGTDGIWESMNPAGEMYGKERMHRAVESALAGSARDITESIVADLKKFRQESRQEDDVTLVVIKATG